MDGGLVPPFLFQPQSHIAGFDQLSLAGEPKII